MTALEEAGLQERDLDNGQKSGEQQKPTTGAMMSTEGYGNVDSGTPASS